MDSELDKVLQKLDSIEERLQRLENNSQIISEERTEVAAKGDLESEVVENHNETVVTRKRVPFCDSCGNKLDNNVSVCQKCSAKLCQHCSIEFRSQIICKRDLQDTYPLSSQGFKILLMLSNEIWNEGHIHDLSGISKKDIDEIINYLKGAGFIETSAFFSNKKLTDRGKEAFHAYAQILGDKGEMAELDRAIAAYFRVRK